MADCDDESRAACEEAVRLGGAIVKAFLEATFEGGRHERRVQKMRDLER